MANPAFFIKTDILCIFLLTNIKVS